MLLFSKCPWSKTKSRATSAEVEQKEQEEQEEQEEQIRTPNNTALLVRENHIDFSLLENDGDEIDQMIQTGESFYRPKPKKTKELSCIFEENQTPESSSFSSSSSSTSFSSSLSLSTTQGNESFGSSPESYKTTESAFSFTTSDVSAWSAYDDRDEYSSKPMTPSVSLKCERSDTPDFLSLPSLITPPATENAPSDIPSSTWSSESGRGLPEYDSDSRSKHSENTPISRQKSMHKTPLDDSDAGSRHYGEKNNTYAESMQSSEYLESMQDEYTETRKPHISLHYKPRPAPVARFDYGTGTTCSSVSSVSQESYWGSTQIWSPLPIPSLNEIRNFESFYDGYDTDFSDGSPKEDSVPAPPPPTLQPLVSSLQISNDSE